MFQVESQPSRLAQTLGILELIYHVSVHNLRKTHSNALMGLFINMLQTMILVAVFYVMYSVLGMRGALIRGDFLLYIMSGIFLYMTQTKSMGAVVGADGPTSPMLQHAPMSTFVSILANALGALYIQVLSVVVVIYIYHIAFTPVHIENWAGAFGMLILAWFSGIGIGLLFYALKPWFPQFATVGSTIYARANMIASGKMFVANTLPFNLLALFSWNPLFHIIDQSRGFMFINYNPHYSNWVYPLIVSIVLVVLGFMGESYTRRHASMSWGAKG